MDQQVYSCCHNILTVTQHYNSNNTPIGRFHAVKITKLVFLYVFTTAFPTSPLVILSFVPYKPFKNVFCPRWNLLSEINHCLESWRKHKQERAAARLEVARMELYKTTPVWKLYISWQRRKRITKCNSFICANHRYFRENHCYSLVFLINSSALLVGSCALLKVGNLRQIVKCNKIA